MFSLMQYKSATASEIGAFKLVLKVPTENDGAEVYGGIKTPKTSLTKRCVLRDHFRLEFHQKLKGRFMFTT
jgi:hypothetical protein